MSWQTRYQLGREPGSSLPAPAPAAPEPAETPSAPSRSFGFRSGALDQAGPAAVHAAVAEKAGAELGEPTSYKGGAGAPAPVEVVRGLRTTYTNPAPDTGGYAPTPSRNTQEFATPQQAMQAYNRGQALAATAAADAKGLTDPNIAARYGTWQPQGAALATITAEKEGPGARQERLQKGELYAAGVEEKKRQEAQEKEKQNLADYQREIHGSAYATFDPSKGQMVFQPKTEDLALDQKAGENVARKEGWEAGLAHLDERQMARKWLQTQKLPTDFNAHAYLNAVYQDKDAWKELVNKAKAASITPGPIRQPGYWDAGKNLPPANPFVS